MTSIYLIRHAQAAGNAGGRFQGRLDHRLTDEGRTQIKRLSRRFQAIALDAVYTSPLSRAKETAAGVAGIHGLTPIAVEDLIEMDLGGFENRSFEELEALYPEELHNFFDAPHLFRGVEGGEDFAAVTTRMTKTLNELSSRHPSKNIALVTHGCALRALLCHLSGLPPERMSEAPWCPNTGVSHVAYIKGTPTLLSVADLSHLEECL